MTMTDLELKINKWEAESLINYLDWHWHLIRFFSIELTTTIQLNIGNHDKNISFVVFDAKTFIFINSRKVS